MEWTPTKTRSPLVYTGNDCRSWILTPFASIPMALYSSCVSLGTFSRPRQRVLNHAGDRRSHRDIERCVVERQMMMW
jgi:hypothetical protein